MDYEKEYKSFMAKVKKAHQFAQTDSTKSVLEDILPQLRESEDERVRKELIDMIKACTNWPHKKEYVKYLEKQKENPKSAGSIPSDCASSAKCEDRWHKTANSLPDNGRDVLAKDALGNYLLASFDGAQWFVSVYDGEDHPVLHTPPILEWCEIPSEKQKEQKPVDYEAELKKCKDNPLYFYDKYVSIKQKSAEWEDYKDKVNIPYCSSEPEWIEEDEDILNSCISSIEEAKENRYAYKETDGDTSYDHEIAWLKSLRPVSKESLQSHWKPSEEQIYSLGTVVKGAGDNSVGSIAYNLKELYEQLKKLI